MEVVKLSKEINVLIVEDMKLDQLLLKKTLNYFGVTCDIAQNGKIAIQKLKEGSYDIVLMDLQMPEMNGYEATSYIRNSMESTIPIIALTSDETMLAIAKCKEVGITDYITKPFNDVLLFSKIFSLIKKHVLVKQSKNNAIETLKIEKGRYSNLAYLKNRTKSNPELMIEMIGIYLEQTPPLLKAIKQSLLHEDWEQLHAAVHKIIPSFSIMGIPVAYEDMAKKIQEFAIIGKRNNEIKHMFLQVENACVQASKELELQLENIKNSANEYHR